jgi:hypothetical protein
MIYPIRKSPLKNVTSLKKLLKIQFTARIWPFLLRVTKNPNLYIRYLI